MAEKVTIMRLKVDLQCDKCYKKVKKVLCKFPQIRDQVFDEKQNIVIIKVVCCNPEKLRDKLCCKGCGAIKSIEIVIPKPEKPPQKPPKTAQPDEKPPEKPPKIARPEKPLEKPPPEKPPTVPCTCPGIPPPARVPIGICCGQCYEGRPGGPCFEGYGGPPPCYEGYYYVRPVYDSYGGGGRPCYVSRRCDQHFSEDNPTACTIM